MANTTENKKQAEAAPAQIEKKTEAGTDSVRLITSIRLSKKSIEKAIDQKVGERYDELRKKAEEDAVQKAVQAKEDLRAKIPKVVSAVKKALDQSRFIFLPEKKFWFDKETATLLPDIYSYEYPLVGYYYGRKTVGVATKLAELPFQEITVKENRTILNGSNKNPFLDKKGRWRKRIYAEGVWVNITLSGGGSDNFAYYSDGWASEGNGSFCWVGGACNPDSNRRGYNMLLVYRLRQKDNTTPLTNKESFKEWRKLKLVPGDDILTLSERVLGCKSDYSIDRAVVRNKLTDALEANGFDGNCVSKAQAILDKEMPASPCTAAAAFVAVEKVLQQFIADDFSPDKLTPVLLTFLPSVNSNKPQAFEDFYRRLKEKGFNIKEFKPALVNLIVDVPISSGCAKCVIIAQEIAEQVADIILDRASGKKQTADIWDAETVRLYEEVMKDWARIEPYVELNDDLSEVTIKDGIDSILTKVEEVKTDKKALENEVREDAQKVARDAYKEELLQSDYLRANIQKYEEEQLTDTNRGHWELTELGEADGEAVELSKPWVARPPQLDIKENGICAIDFGTKSTIVVCDDGEAKLLRVGTGNYENEPRPTDYENPTAMEFRDIKSFLAAYKAEKGRPHTKWAQLTVSHEAVAAYNKLTEYSSLFSELKQWANDKKRIQLLRDQKGQDLTLKPYLQLTEGEFDPIELYAYYLGLYINNMHHGIYLTYLLSYPVNYDREVREHIRQSFERGIRKSLPEAIQNELEKRHFSVTAEVSEPAAYAATALKEYGLEPKTAGEKVAYAVFDFGGGTTDFDFGIETKSDKPAKFKYEIKQFGSGGDVYLGGEHILNLMAYEVYKENLTEMRKNKIPFVLPPEVLPPAGTETLLFTTADAPQAAYKNRYALAELLRPIWEGKADKLNEQGNNMSVTLYPIGKKGEGENTVQATFCADTDNEPEGLQLKAIDDTKLLECAKARIERGVDSFFQKMNSAFFCHAEEAEGISSINILLAGNSCRSQLVKELFDEKINKWQADLKKNITKTTGQQKDTSGSLILKMPLGMSEEPPKAKPTDIDKQRTGKTGVAFGLLRARKGGRDVRIVNANNDADNKNERLFPYYLGKPDDADCFDIKIGMSVGYGSWAEFTYADEDCFELYYTADGLAEQPGRLKITEAKKALCWLEKDEVSKDDEVKVYVRKKTPDTIEYAVGKEADFEKEVSEDKIHMKKLPA